MTLKKPTRVQLAGGIALLLVLALPLPQQIVPAWSLQLIDTAGVPQPGIPTAQTWRHPVLQPDRHEETQVSDAEGRVAFPERTTWSNGLLALFNGFATLMADGINTSFAPDAKVHAGKSEALGGSDFYISGKSPPATVIIRRYGVCPADDVPQAK